MKKLLSLLFAACLLLAGCAEHPIETTPPTTETTQAQTETTQETVAADKLIALTFDDGPNSNTMLDLLVILEQYNVKATFFLIGKMVSSNAVAVKRLYQAGHEIGNHSYSHIDLAKLSEDEILAEIENCQIAVESVTGVRPALFRPPFLSTSDSMDKLMDLPYASGYGIGDGTIGTGAADRAYKALSQAHDGAILLMHCFTGCEETLLALHTIIPELRSQGYEFVTVSELFARKGITPQTGILYKEVN